MEDYRLSQTGQEVQNILNGAAMQVDLNTEVERATDAEGTLQENIDAEAQARQDADGLLQQGIDDEAQRAKDAEEANAGEIEGIKALIPSTASEVNKLADTNYVNSSIQTATAEYRGDYNVVTDLHLAIDATHAQIETLLPTVIAEADKNDYCYVMIPTNASTPTEIAKIERYKMTSEGWKFEYDVNNSTFTAEEWAAIKSGITSGLVAKLNALPTNADLLLLLAGKQDVLTFDAVPVPESNNPVKSGGVYSAIDDEKTARLNSDTAIHAELDGLQAKVPETASSDNKLVDQNQMNSSISTATATYRGDWNVVSDLHLAVDATRAQIAALLPTVISTADNNDYCYVEIPTSAETPTQIERVERYKFNGTAWGYEYTLNNSGFTAAQWAAINSMITSGLVAKLTALPTNTDLIAMFAQKQDVLTFDSTPTENSTNPVTSGGVFAADKALSDAIEAILLLIPSAASSLNKLVDTALMNSSISTATATFRGTYNLVSDLGLGIDATEGQIAAALLANISTADNNDYAFVQIPTSAETPAQIARTDRYKFNGTAWAFEYTLNTSGFTAAQWAAINSTITSALVAKLNALPTAAELQEALGTLTSGITAINQKIPATASQSNKLVDNASMESYIAQVIGILDASFNVTSTDGHITLHITQVDGVITSVQVQGSDIASAADLALNASQITALASRVTTAESNITSLTGRMGTAETNIANLQQLYNNLQQSKPVPVTALPSTGQQQDVIYRLAGTTSYSDYMWNGSSWVLMATYNNAIDDEPTAGSNNLVKSGGVFDGLKSLDCDINGVSFVSGYIDSSGNLVPPDGRSQCTSELLPASIVNGLVATFDDAKWMLRLAYYDNSGTFVSRSESYENSPATINTSYNARITLTTHNSGTSETIKDVINAFTFSTLDLNGLKKEVNDINDEVSELNNTVNGVPQWSNGNIDYSGNIVASTQSNYYSQIIDNSLIDGISIQVNAGFLANLAFYNNGSFIGRYGWIDSGSGKVTIDTNYDARLMICLNASDNTKSVEEVLGGITMNGINLGFYKYVKDSLKSFEEQNDYLSKVQACDFDGKILHFSFDDVCWCLYDLIQNEATYESIFDEPFFAMLKEVHDSTGMVFTLNTFNEIAESPSTYYPVGFDITDVPNKFQSDFQANKGWLRFAFHGKNESSNYNTDIDAATDYATFVSAIYTLTGDYDCIDRVTRLGFFGGSLDNCLALKDAAYGPVGFFGADDTRAYDYYLTEKQYAWLRKKGKYFDQANQLLFIKTQNRTFSTGKQDVENNLCFQKVTEFFAHEYEGHPGGSWNITNMKNNLLDIASWATNLGYKFYYPENIFA